MRVTITGINFKYDNGYGEEYTGVELQFITSGFKFSNNTPVQITKEQYEANKSNTNGLRALVVDKVLADVQEYIDDLNKYKSGLLDV
ncbi:hypothetical protein [Oceanobacillus indicireducens]|uniref:Uncharacterized protein n=1 Tax=Oceanobacillus indicireducens TaxID=1004261 RepID=A0A918D1Y8_9BACI|nr:hypothetical protein [Oceanobacillus indicireducens]GGN59274.1 hypothetical protein GCM10007971_22220 [Oceanobacillus indicireducens]